MFRQQIELLSKAAETLHQVTLTIQDIVDTMREYEVIEEDHDPEGEPAHCCDEDEPKVKAVAL